MSKHVCPFSFSICGLAPSSLGQMLCLLPHKSGGANVQNAQRDRGVQKGHCYLNRVNGLNFSCRVITSLMILGRPSTVVWKLVTKMGIWRGGGHRAGERQVAPQWRPGFNVVLPPHSSVLRMHTLGGSGWIRSQQLDFWLPMRDIWIEFPTPSFPQPSLWASGNKATEESLVSLTWRRKKNWPQKSDSHINRLKYTQT